MSQLLLPLFPSSSMMITPSLAVYEQGDTIYYLHCGMPIYSHHKEDMKKFRYVTSSLVLQGLCKQSDIVETFQVSSNSVSKWKLKLEKEGESGFFGTDSRHGHSYRLIPPLLGQIQEKLDKGQSVNSIAKESDVSEGTIRYGIKTGILKKKLCESTIEEENESKAENEFTEAMVPVITTRSERSATDSKCAIGIGATMELERGLASSGKQDYALSCFAHHQSVFNAGVLFSLPFLISQGLYKILNNFAPLRKGFYGLHHIIILMCFMALLRIKNPEQLKQCPVGELSKLMGPDRVPQVEYLRVKIKEITSQSRCDIVHQALFESWTKDLTEKFFG